jgi:hypothetical protein
VRVTNAVGHDQKVATQELHRDLDGPPASPLVLVEWVDEDRSRRVHTWSSYRELAQELWDTHGEWALQEGDAPPPANPAADLVWEIVSGVGHDAVLVVRALIETAPSAAALTLVGAGELEELFQDDRVDDAAVTAMRGFVEHDERWALAASHMWIDENVSVERQAVMAALGARRPGNCAAVARDPDG